MSNASVDALREHRRPSDAPPNAATVDFTRELRARFRAVDLLLLAGVPVLLVALFSLPRETRLSLGLRGTDPTLASAFTSHYVHLTPEHLLANLLGYLLLVPLVYLICLLNGHRRLFLAALVTFLFAFPFALSGLELAMGQRGLALGFSGINSAFFGLLAFSLAWYVRNRFGGHTDGRYAPPAFFLVVAIVAVIAVPWTVQSVGVAVAALLSVILYSEAVLGGIGLPTLSGIRSAANQPGYFELAAAGVALFFAYPFVAFPADVVSTAGVVNLYAHLLGFCLAFIVTFVTSLVAPWEGTVDISST